MNNYRVLFHGYVKDDNLLPPERRQYKFLNADHEFSKPTNSWKPGEIMLDEIVLDLQSGDYNFVFGLYDRTSFKQVTKSFDFGWRRLPASNEE